MVPYAAHAGLSEEEEGWADKEACWSWKNLGRKKMLKRIDPCERKMKRNECCAQLADKPKRTDLRRREESSTKGAGGNWVGQARAYFGCMGH